MNGKQANGMSKGDASDLAGEMEDFLGIPAFVCEAIERDLELGDYEQVCRYILKRRRELCEPVEKEAASASAGGAVEVTER